MNNKNIKYINKDFDGLLNQLTSYSKSYFPNLYRDFTSESIGMMFFELSSYVGDVLSFYIDNQIQENFIEYAQQEKNIFNLANFFNYKPKNVNISSVILNIYQLVPAIDNNTPDYDYTLYIKENTIVTTENGKSFLISENIALNPSLSDNKIEVSEAQINNGNVEFFLLKTTAKAYSVNIKTKEYAINNYEDFLTLSLKDNNIVGISKIIDGDNNEWYEVNNLAQNVIYLDELNNNYIPNEGEPLYKLNPITSNRRFKVKFKSFDTIEIQFGVGDKNIPDEEIIPNQFNVGINLPQINRNLIKTGFNSENLMFTNSYGSSPYKTTLTVEYITSEGIESNVDSNQNFLIPNSQISFYKDNLDVNLANFIFDSLSITNTEPASGGGNGDNLNDIKLKTQLQFYSQYRIITPKDYKTAILNLPPKYGKISKIFAKPNIDSNIDIYLLSENRDNKLIVPSFNLKNNIKKYIKNTTENVIVNLKNAYIINIGCEFDIITFSNVNNNEVLLNCINVLKEHFDINRWDIGQPILLRNIYNKLDNVKGVQTVQDVRINNRVGESNGYSKYEYDIKGATISNIIYPPINPSIFEIKYPNEDIIGKIINF